MEWRKVCERDGKCLSANVAAVYTQRNCLNPLNLKRQ
jgi:hypothetical protein